MKFYVLTIAVTLLLSGALNANAADSVLVNAITAEMPHNLDKAEALIVSALKSDPDNAELQFLCGRIMGRQAENAFISALSYAKKSLNCLTTSVTLAPTNIDYRMGLIRFYLGAPAIAGGDKKLAEKQVNDIYQLSELDGVKAKMLYLTTLEKNDEYVTVLQQALAQFPQYSEFHYRLGLQYQQQKNFNDAHNSFLKAAAYAGESDANYLLNALYQLGRNAVFSEMELERGVEALEQFIAIGPTSTKVPPLEWAHLRLAQLAKLRQKPLLMEYHLEQALSSDDKELHRMVRQLKRQVKEAT